MKALIEHSIMASRGIELVPITAIDQDELMTFAMKNQRRVAQIMGDEPLDVSTEEARFESYATQEERLKSQIVDHKEGTRLQYGIHVDVDRYKAPQLTGITTVTFENTDATLEDEADTQLKLGDIAVNAAKFAYCKEPGWKHAGFELAAASATVSRVLRNVPEVAVVISEVPARNRTAARVLMRLGAVEVSGNTDDYENDVLRYEVTRDQLLTVGDGLVV